METVSTKTGIQSILIINQIVREDEGLYTCSMSNPFGSDAETLKVVVQGMSKTYSTRSFFNFFLLCTMYDFHNSTDTLKF